MIPSIQGLWGGFVCFFLLLLLLLFWGVVCLFVFRRSSRCVEEKNHLYCVSLSKKDWFDHTRSYTVPNSETTTKALQQHHDHMKYHFCVCSRPRDCPPVLLEPHAQKLIPSETPVNVPLSKDHPLFSDHLCTVFMAVAHQRCPCTLS